MSGEWVKNPDGTLTMPNVKRCDLCGGHVDRICHDIPDPHVIYKTKHFECRSCGAIGDPVVGIMSDTRLIGRQWETEQNTAKS